MIYETLVFHCAHIKAMTPVLITNNTISKILPENYVQRYETLTLD